ncbi:MAG: hypothetical protein GX594_12285 [Pirellulaceae bacterium]|nr:hypothetical protein [Pirellulaceae bacterium]
MIRNATILCYVCLAALSVAANGQAAGGKTVVVKTDRKIVLSNDMLELAFDASGERPTLSRLTNRLSGRAIPIASDDFAIGLEGREPLRGADFRLVKTTPETLPGGRRIVFNLACEEPKVELKLSYELGDGDFFTRRRLVIVPAKDKPLELRELEAWRVGIEGAAAYQGYGVPIYLDDTFWGLEFPGGRNTYADGAVSLKHHPGRAIGKPYAAKTAVVGAAEPGRVRPRFLEYVRSFQATSKDLKLFVNYNTWWTLMPPTEQNCLELIDLFRERLFLPHGVSIDTFTIDDGWDEKNSLWDIRKDRFPRGFAPLAERLKSIDANLGLWLSPSSGYNHAPWGEANGYARNTNNFYLCQSWPKYRRDIERVVTALTEKYDFAFFKFDGFEANCAAPDHGHLPGDYAREANIEAFCDLMAAVRRVRPDCYIDPTCGMWLSPWWLQWADSIWGPVSGDQASAIVPAPISRISSTATRDSFFRLRCRDYQGFPPEAVEHLGIIVITPEPWEDNAMAVLGRGCRLLTLYINPECFKRGGRDWAFLASILKWARHNGATLHNNCAMILGEPMKRQPYGYAHFNERHGIVSLRNPFVDHLDVEVRLDETAGWSAAAAGEGQYAVNIVYPRHETLARPIRFGDPLKLTLAPYETVIAQIEPLDAERPALLGARARLVKAERNRLEYEIHATPDRDQRIMLIGPKPTSIVLDGRPIEAVETGGRFAFELPKRTTDSPTVEGGRLEMLPSEKGFKLVGDCTVLVPDGAEGSIHFLCEFAAPERRELECDAQIDGRPVKVEIVRKEWKQMSDETDPGRAWTWFKFDLPAGRSKIDLTIDNYQADGKPLGGAVGWWLWTELPTERHKLVWETERGVAGMAEAPLPLPLGMERIRRVTPIRRLAPFAAE